MRKIVLGTLMLIVGIGLFSLTGCAKKPVADVPQVPVFQFEQYVHNEGLRGKFAFESHDVIRVTPDKKATDNTFEFTGAILSKLTKKKKNREVVRLDKDLMWQVNLDDELYQEFPIKKASLQMGVSVDDPNGETVYVENCCTAKTNVNRTGKRQLINGYDAEQVILTWSSACQEEAGEANSTLIKVEIWTAPAVKLGEQLRAFDENFAKKTGANLMLLKSTGEESLKLFPGLRELAKMMAGLKGYPILTTVTIEDKNYLKRFNEQRAQADAQKKTETPTSFSGMAGGFLSQKMDERKRKKEDEENLKWGNVIWRMSFEARNFAQTSVPATDFELSEDWDKVEQKEQLEGNNTTNTAVIEAKPAHYVPTVCLSKVDRSMVGIDLYPGSRPARQRPYSEEDHNTRWYYKNRNDFNVQFSTSDPLEKIVAFYEGKFGKNACSATTKKVDGDSYKDWTCIGKGLVFRADDRPLEVTLDMGSMAAGGGNAPPGMYAYSLGSK